jgi:hypothetical protein
MGISIKQKTKDLICDLIYYRVVPMLSKKKVPYSLNCFDKSITCFELRDVQAGVFSKHSTEYLNEQKFLDACNTVKMGLPPSAKKAFREDLRLRYYTACKFAKIASPLEGAFVSVGVSFGVTPRLVLEYTSLMKERNKEYWLVDAWDGYDPYRSKVIKTRTAHDQYCSNINDVKEIFSRYDNVRIVQGFAPEALHGIEAEKNRFPAFGYDGSRM